MQQKLSFSCRTIKEDESVALTLSKFDKKQQKKDNFRKAKRP
jgi:hypothetical protein